MNTLYYDLFAGISGDMHLGALLDLGVPEQHLREELGRLGLGGFDIDVRRDSRKAITGTRVEVLLTDVGHGRVSHVHDSHVHGSPHAHHRNLRDIKGIVSSSELSEAVKSRSLAMFRRLAEAEAKIHGSTVDEIHFHEVGAVDSIVDIVGAAVCLEYLSVDRILASPVELGGGFVHCAHGTLPVPAPATAELLRGIPVKTGAVPHEMTTPTGAVILAVNVHEFTPNMGLTVERVGYGIGGRDTDIPNVLRVFLGESDNDAGAVCGERGRVAPMQDVDRVDAVLLECNIDDMNPEIYEYLMDKLLEDGASDVFFTPITMKKSRPAVKISVLCGPEGEGDALETLLLNTPTLGVRSTRVSKTTLRRDFSTVDTPFGEVRVKNAHYGGRLIKSKPEYEDCRRLAEQAGVPLREVYDSIPPAAWRQTCSVEDGTEDGDAGG